MSARPKPPFRTRLRRALRARLLGAMLSLGSLLPLRLALFLGRVAGHLAFRVARKQRALALEHLSAAYPEWPQEKQEAVARAVFEGLGEHLFENLAARAVERRLPEWVEIPAEDRATLEAALEAGRGAVLATGHIGNWEIGARALAHRGYPLTAIARRSHDPGLQRVLERFRGRAGLEIVYRGSPRAGIEILRALRGGRGLLLLVDQDLDVPGLHVPFFGRPAYSARAPAELALRRDAALLVGWIHRTRPGGPHRISIRRIEVQPTGDREADVRALTEAVQATLEAAIRTAPEQWVWFHRRWLRAPDER